MGVVYGCGGRGICGFMQEYALWSGGICFRPRESVGGVVDAHAWTMWSMRCESKVRVRESGVIRPRSCCLGSCHVYRTYRSLIGRSDLFALPPVYNC